MKNDQNQSSQGSNQKRSQTELDSIFRSNGSKFGSENDANQFLKEHGLTAKFSGDTADIFDTQNNRVASVQLTGQQGNRSISSINY